MSRSIVTVAALSLAIACERKVGAPSQSVSATSTTGSALGAAGNNKRLEFAKYTVDFDPNPTLASTAGGGPPSNILRSDYAGPDACKSCHERNYESWSRHAHRWMNASANASTVKGDFSSGATIRYLGGTGVFFREGEGYRMRLERGALRRTYAITRTIGSRFFQYYVGHQVEGPEPPQHPQYKLDQVLPFGYWLSERWWVPVVHVTDDDGRQELSQKQIDPYTRPSGTEYDTACSQCHTTKPLADWLVINYANMKTFAPRPMTMYASAYLKDVRPDVFRDTLTPQPADQEGLLRAYGALKERMTALPSSEHAVTLGISCEACHLGAKAHVAEKERMLPPFLPRGRYVSVATSSPAETGRTHDNKNWICSRCHVGRRPEFANGTNTWNSTEFTDASRGSCYSQLTCVRCHDPHKPIGLAWQSTPAQDDQTCLSCHSKYSAPVAVEQHTHHRADSEGSRCLNCHMPKINEGLETMVRTHRIFSPTDARMIESNQPNACNLCHLDRPIDWTLQALREWYGKSYQEPSLAQVYPKREGPTGIGWLNSRHPPTRMTAAVALAKAKATWALPALVEMLDDPVLLNRQFTQKAIEPLLGTRLERSGYRFYMSPEERAKPLTQLRSQVGVSRGKLSRLKMTRDKRL